MNQAPAQAQGIDGGDVRLTAGTRNRGDGPRIALEQRADVDDVGVDKGRILTRVIDHGDAHQRVQERSEVRAQRIVSPGATVFVPVQEVDEGGVRGVGEGERRVRHVEQPFIAKLACGQL